MKQRLPTFGGGVKVVNTAPSNATNGATVGVNLYDPSGKVVQWSDILNPASTPTTFSGTSDDVPEGQWNLYFTNARAQDAVGAIVVDSSEIDFTYTPSSPGPASLTAVLKTTGVTANTYGDSTHVAVVTIDSKGRITNASAVAINALTPAQVMARISLGF